MAFKSPFQPKPFDDTFLLSSNTPTECCRDTRMGYQVLWGSHHQHLATKLSRRWAPIALPRSQTTSLLPTPETTLGSSTMPAHVRRVPAQGWEQPGPRPGLCQVTASASSSSALRSTSTTGENRKHVRPLHFDNSNWLHFSSWRANLIELTLYRTRTARMEVTRENQQKQQTRAHHKG